MGKSGVASFNKAIANKIKAKGLQKLRWFCQVCEKQCRDENGFKCHINSESHQRAMVSFSHNAGKMLSQFSREFEGAFLDIAKRRARSQFIAANLIYNELISDRFHTHMNATVWVTLSNFVQHLARSGKCIVEERPKGLFIMYVEKDPDVVRRQQAIMKSRKHELDEEARNLEYIKDRVAKAQATDEGPSEASATETTKPADAIDLATLDSSAFSFSLKPATKRVFGFMSQPSAPAPAAVAGGVANGGESGAGSNGGANGNGKDTAGADKADNGEGEPNPEEEGDGMYVDEFGRLRSLADDVSAEEEIEKPATEDAPADAPPPAAAAKPASTAPPTDSRPANGPPPAAAVVPAGTKIPETATQVAPVAKPAPPGESKRKLTAVEEIMLAEEQKKDKMKRRDYWLFEGIVVKVMNKQLADGKYYKKKGVVEKVIDRYVALISMLDTDVKGHKLKLDQNQLETVIPSINGKMLIVNGAYRGEQVTLLAVDIDNFCVQVRVDHGLHHGRVLDRIAYEDICKLHVG